MVSFLTTISVVSMVMFIPGRSLPGKGGYSIKSIADESEYSKAFVSERIYVFQNELKKEISKKQSKVKN